MNALVNNLIKMLLIALILVLDRMGAMPETSVRPGAYWRQPQPILTKAGTEIRTENGFLYYGQLVMEAPDGVNVMKHKLGHEWTADVIDLGSGTDKQLVPRIWITHYRASDLNEWEVTGALLDLMPDTSLRLRYRDKETDSRLFTYTCGYKNGYILMYGEDIYIVEEMQEESERGFGGMLDERAVCWADGYGCGDRNNDRYDVWFDKLAAGEDAFLVFRYTGKDGMRRLGLMKDGDYGHVYQEIVTGPPGADEWLICKDYNFDGYTDINFLNKTLYLWNADHGQYERADVPAEFMQLQSEAFFADTETIWGYRCEDEDEESGSDSGEIDETETLWQWENRGGNVLIKRRECKAQIQGESVRMRCSDTVGYPDAIFDQTVTLEEYRQGSAVVRGLYNKFYDNMAPDETYARAHPIAYGQEHIRLIPQSLLDRTAEVMSEKAGQGELFPGHSGRQLGISEILSAARDNTDVRQAYLTAGQFYMVRVDGDNDGIEDIIMRRRSEASNGGDDLLDYIFFQGQKDGTYQKTDECVSMQGELGFIDYEGKYYLRRAHYNRDKDRYEDISYLRFEDGKIAEQADLVLVPEGYVIGPAQFSQKEYQSYVERLTADALTYKALYDRNGKVVGSCENELSEDEKYPYECDLNNDGGGGAAYERAGSPGQRQRAPVFSFRWTGGGRGGSK